MDARLTLDSLAPEAMKMLLELEKHARRSVEQKLYYLVKLRASVLNGCAYCIDMHTTDAAREGEHPRRLSAVAAWRESPFFTPKERAALALTDAVTKIGERGVPDDIWSGAKEFWSEKELADLLLLIVMINAWNRIAVTSRVQAPPLA